MAGRPLKQPEVRRNRTPPQRGEWIDLPAALEEPVLGPFDPDTMGVRERMWNGWRRDPLTSQYTEADIEAIYELATTWNDRTFADRDRQMDKLGLTPKGRRDLRWRTPLEARQQVEATAKAKITRLHAVAKDS